MQSSHYHVYSLPVELLDTLTPRNLVNQPPGPTPISEPSEQTPATTTGARACNICLAATFLDVDEQRAHFRSDWHRYNVKTRLNGGNPVSEVAFGELVDGVYLSLFIMASRF